jgi:hypothetical protein
VLVEPAGVSVPVTVTEVQPGALTVNVAAPVPDEFAATVTGWGRFQFPDVSVTVLPADTDRPLLPAVLATVTVMPAAGAADSETPNTSLVPWATENEPGLASSVTPDPQEPPPVEVGDGDGVGVPVGVGEEVGEVDGLGDGDPPVPLQAVPLMVNAVGAVLVPL